MKKYIKVIAVLAIISLILLCVIACDKKEKEQGFLVTFETNGGQQLESYFADYIEDLPIISKDGFYLDGWYTDSDYKNHVTFPLKIIRDTTLYARWITSQSGSPNLVFLFNEETDSYSVTGYNGKSHNVIIPQSFEDKDITEISDGAFNNCHTVTKIYIPDSVTTIGRAFFRAESLTDIIVSANNQRYKTEEGALYSKDGTQLISYPPAKEGDTFVIPYSVISIENFAVRFCKNLKHIVISENVISIERYFDGCINLESITVNENNGVFKSKEGVLYSKDGKSLLRYPHNHIQKTFNVPQGVEQFFEYAFSQSEIVVINISDTVKVIPSFEDCKKMTDINVNSNNTVYKSMEGVLFDKEGRTLLHYPQAKEGNVYTIENESKEYYEYHIPIGVEIISSWAFTSCNKLNRVVIPSTVKRIEDYAFSNLEGGFTLSEIIFEAESLLQSVGDRAFIDCPLSVVTLTAVVPPLTGSEIFSVASSNLIIYAPENTFDLYQKSHWNNFGVLKAGSAAKTYTVKFFTNGGAPLQDLNTVYLYEEIIPSRENYIFGGWYNNLELNGEQIDFPLMVSGDINFYAKWYSNEEGTQGLTFSLQTSTNTYAVSGYNGNDEEVILPSTHNGKLVTAISSNAFSEKTFITKVYIPETIAHIGNSAFAGSSNAIMRIESVIFSENTKLKSIGSYAFQYCALLKSINLPLTLESIGNGVFSNCILLNEIYVPKNVMSIGAYAFSDCDSLASINTDIHNEFFTSEEGVLYNKNKTILIKYPAAKSNLNFVIPDGVTSIAPEAFYASRNLLNIIFSDSVMEIGARAFHYCSSIENIILPANMTIFNPSVFRNTNVRSITLSASVEILQDNFNSLYSLENIFVDNSNSNYKSINGILYSFNQKTLIRCPIAKKGEVVLWKDTEEIGAKAFYECEINNIILNQSLSAIGSEAFYNCKNITSINLAESLSFIDDRAFMYSTDLKTVYIHSSTEYPQLGNNVFAGANNSRGITVYASDSLREELRNDDKWNGYNILSTTVIRDEMELQLIYDEYYRLTKHLSSGTDIVVPAQIDGIEIREIGEYAFSSNVRRITLPNTIRIVRTHAFTSNSNSQLTTIIFEENSQLFSISTNAFYNCNKLTSLILNCHTPPAVSGDSTLSELKDFLKVYVIDINSYLNTPFSSCVLRNISALEGDFAYSEDEQGITVIGYIGADTEITIPSTINGKSVIAIGANVINPTIKKVVVDSTVNHILGCAFSTAIYNRDEGFFALKEVEIIGNSLISIGERAFEGTDIDAINIPSSVQIISNIAFRNCINLKRINVDQANVLFSSYGGVLFNKDMTELIIYPSGKLDAEYTLPLTTRTVGQYAFENSHNLIKIILNAELEKIESYAFYGCIRLIDLKLPEGLLKIDSFAFKGCNRLFSLALPVNLAEFNGSAVIDCSSLTKVYVSPMNEEFSVLDGVLFDKEAKKLISYPSGRTGNYILPQSVQYIEPYAFYGSRLSSVTLSENILGIGEFAFAFSRQLVTVNIESQLNELPEGMLLGCINLENLNISQTVTVIGDFFAEGCVKLRNLVFPINLQSIGKRAFAECSILNQVILPANVVALGDEAFHNCKNITNITLPNSLVDVGENTLNGLSNLNSISMSANFTLKYLFGTEDNSIPVSIKNININEGVSILPEAFFKDCLHIQNVILPSTLTIIKREAFMNCASLATVERKGAYEFNSIEEYAFWNCFNLASFKLMTNTPASAHSLAFSGEYGGTTEVLHNLCLYVPLSSINDYKTAWSIEKVYAI